MPYMGGSPTPSSLLTAPFQLRHRTCLLPLEKLCTREPLTSASSSPSASKLLQKLSFPLTQESFKLLVGSSDTERPNSKSFKRRKRVQRCHARRRKKRGGQDGLESIFLYAKTVYYVSRRSFLPASPKVPPHFSSISPILFPGPSPPPPEILTSVA